jgi:hypothetical protein
LFLTLLVSPFQIKTLENGISTLRINYPEEVTLIQKGGRAAKILHRESTLHHDKENQETQHTARTKTKQTTKSKETTEDIKFGYAAESTPETPNHGSHQSDTKNKRTGQLNAMDARREIGFGDTMGEPDFGQMAQEVKVMSATEQAEERELREKNDFEEARLTSMMNSREEMIDEVMEGTNFLLLLQAEQRKVRKAEEELKKEREERKKAEAKWRKAEAKWRQELLDLRMTLEEREEISQLCFLLENDILDEENKIAVIKEVVAGKKNAVDRLLSGFIRIKDESALRPNPSNTLYRLHMEKLNFLPWTNFMQDQVNHISDPCLLTSKAFYCLEFPKDNKRNEN